MCRNTTAGKPGYLHLKFWWADTTKHKCAVLEETTNHYLIRFEDKSIFGRYVTGVVRWVPKFAVTFVEEKT